jgi:hypothetical protein
VAGVGPWRELAGELAVPAKQVEVHGPSVGRRDARSHPNFRVDSFRP